jgi:hypothetical protein
MGQLIDALVNRDTEHIPCLTPWANKGLFGKMGHAQTIHDSKAENP